MYSPKKKERIFAKIIERISEGESLRSICRSKKFPDAATVFRWLDDPILCEQYVRAKKQSSDFYFDEARNIAAKADPNNVHVAKLQIDTLKWIHSHLEPKREDRTIEKPFSHQFSMTPIDEVLQYIPIEHLKAATEQAKAKYEGRV